MTTPNFTSPSNALPGGFARVGWIATMVLFAIMLMANALAGFHGSRLALAGLDRGQADFFGSGLWELLTDSSGLSDAPQLDRFYEANQRRGLRYVALVGEDGHTVASVGRALADPPQPVQHADTARIPLVKVGNRLRAYFPGRVSPTDAPGQVSRVVVEFEPNAATRVAVMARRSLVLAVAAAVVLSFVAWIFFRQSIRYEAARLRLEQQRHLALLGEMSAVLAHEIRNPLASLKGHAQLAAERLADGSRERLCVEHVIDDSNRLDALTSDLLSFARSSPLELEPVNPVDLMRAATADVFSEESLMMDAAHAPATWPLDAGRMRQALVNLLDNARKASPRGMLPVTRVAHDAGCLVFEVQDFGPGLPAGKEHRIFDPFFTTRTNGTGLGLAVASRVVEMHHGVITATNHAAGGAVFRLSIPRTGG
jgi:two-component system sensor histidine kinase HydH